MRTWKSETREYREIVRALLAQLPIDAALPIGMPSLPLGREPNPIECSCYGAYSYLRFGVILRIREIVEGISTLLSGGHVGPTAPLIRLVFEISVVSQYLTDTLKSLADLLELPEANRSVARIEVLLRRISRIHEGVRSPVVLPWGHLAGEKPVHIHKLIQELGGDAAGDYDFLCEGCHPNLPQYYQWQLAGNVGDNWDNDTAARYCHELLARAFGILQTSVTDAVLASELALELCRRVYGLADA